MVHRLSAVYSRDFVSRIKEILAVTSRKETCWYVGGSGELLYRVLAFGTVFWSEAVSAT